MVDLKGLALMWLIFFVADKFFLLTTEVVGKLMVVFSKPRNSLWELIDANRHLWSAVLLKMGICLCALFIIISLAMQSQQKVLLSVSFLETVGWKVAIEITLKDFLWAIGMGLIVGVGMAIWMCSTFWRNWRDYNSSSG